MSDKIGSIRLKLDEYIAARFEASLAPGPPGGSQQRDALRCPVTDARSPVAIDDEVAAGWLAGVNTDGAAPETQAALLELARLSGSDSIRDKVAHAMGPVPADPRYTSGALPAAYSRQERVAKAAQIAGAVLGQADLVRIVSRHPALLCDSAFAQAVEKRFAWLPRALGRIPLTGDSAPEQRARDTYLQALSVTNEALVQMARRNPRLVGDQAFLSAVEARSPGLRQAIERFAWRSGPEVRKEIEQAMQQPTWRSDVAHWASVGAALAVHPQLADDIFARHDKHGGATTSVALDDLAIKVLASYRADFLWELAPATARLVDDPSNPIAALFRSQTTDKVARVQAYWRLVLEDQRENIEDLLARAPIETLANEYFLAAALAQVADDEPRIKRALGAALQRLMPAGWLDNKSFVMRLATALVLVGSDNVSRVSASLQQLADSVDSIFLQKELIRFAAAVRQNLLRHPLHVARSLASVVGDRQRVDNILDGIRFDCLSNETFVRDVLSALQALEKPSPNDEYSRDEWRYAVREFIDRTRPEMARPALCREWLDVPGPSPQQAAPH